MTDRAFTEEDRQKGQETKRKRRAELAKLQPLKIHGGRLSLADYLNEPEAPFITRDEAIKLRCLDCVGNASNEVKLCSAEKCPLWPYRLDAYQRPGQDYWSTHREWDPAWEVETGQANAK